MKQNKKHQASGRTTLVRTLTPPHPPGPAYLSPYRCDKMTPPVVNLIDLYSDLQLEMDAPAGRVILSLFLTFRCLNPAP